MIENYTGKLYLSFSHHEKQVQTEKLVRTGTVLTQICFRYFLYF